jgi:hypothetical protein
MFEICRQQPEITRSLDFPLIVKAAYAFGAIHDAAEKIDHNLPPSSPIPVDRQWSMARM